MRAFDGIRVLDFTHVFAGPFATFQLGVMGAEIIKIEPPHIPDMMRHYGADDELNKQGVGLAYQVNNQGKKAITLNLCSEQGLDIARELIKTADVLVENYTNGLSGFSLGPDEAMALNPRLIYCDMSGFGNDNAFSGRPAYDTVIQAFSGMMSVNGEASQPNLRVGPPLIDYGTGAQTAFAIAAALFQRSQTGKGQFIEVNMLDAALLMMSPLVANAIHNGKTDARSGNVPPDLPGYAAFPCSDDVIMVGAFSPAQHQKLFNVLELNKLTELPETLNKNWLAEHKAELRQHMISRFATKTASDWESILNQADIPGARVRDLYGMLSNEQFERHPNSQFHRVPDNELTAPITAFRYAEDGPEFDARCAQHGEDTEAVLTELGIDTVQIASLRKQGVI